MYAVGAGPSDEAWLIALLDPSGVQTQFATDPERTLPAGARVG